MQPKDYTSKLLALLPIFSLVILIYSGLKLYSYYSLFNLNIFEFIDLGDLIPQSVTDLLFGLVFVLITSLFTYGFNESFYADESDRPIKEDDVEPSFYGILLAVFSIKISFNFLKSWGNFKRFCIENYLNLILIIFFIVLPVLFYHNIVNPYPSFLPMWVHKSFFYFVLAIYTVFLCTVALTVFYKKDKAFVIIIPLAIMLFLFGYFQGKFGYYEKYQNTNSINFSINVSGKKINSSKDFFYIGKTKSYVFFYNGKTNLPTIYPERLVDEFTVGLK